MAREGVPLIVIHRQLGHTNLGITSIYLEGIDSTEIIDTVHARRAPTVPQLVARLKAARPAAGSWVPAAGPRPKGAVGNGLSRPPESVGFVGEQQPRPALVLVVPGSSEPAAVNA
jgi:hypothetical protein